MVIITRNKIRINNSNIEVYEGLGISWWGLELTLKCASKEGVQSIYCDSNIRYEHITLKDNDHKD